MTKSLDQLRRDAKALRRAYEADEIYARQRVANHPPRPDGAPLKHADFLHVIAREAQFESWPALKLAAELQGLDRAALQQRLKIAIFQGQSHVIEKLLTDTPDLAEGQFGLQVALYDLMAVKAVLAVDQQAAVRPLGPRTPMCHLAFSRYIHHRPDRADDMIALAELLLAHGASVNDSMPVAPDNDHQLSALYGAIGHANNMILGQWLLEHGADPNDGESLYHATELGHHEGLRLLLKHGADPRGTNALLRAMDFHDVEAVRLLLAAGARPNDFDGTHVGGERPWVIPALHQAARRMSRREMVELLLAAGADPADTYEGHSAYAYARVFGNQVLADAIEAKGTAPRLSPVEEMLANAASGGDVGGARIDPAQLPGAYRDIIRMILHLPGKGDHIKRLVGLGVPFDAPDAEGLTPLHVAGWEGLPELMTYFIEIGANLDHQNGYGGTLLSTILHGSENCPQRAERDHAACLVAALQAGVPVPRRAPDAAVDPVLADLLADWVDHHPEQVVDGGPL
ncbi:ankyrin repeat domain-containing protein [Roseobacter sp. MH60115]|uniref:ankyrin repeat domain-containing protein n=1 Tax=Roseobacter sp. MH60115 TaxID=2785324 RepID=UPI0018A3050B|nr:ankyrin repeat domain-containing protein [Roseobacter sp. MH60115]